MRAYKFLFGVLVVVSLAGCYRGEVDPKTTPVIAFYKRQGEQNLDCTFVMTNGVHKFSDNTCTNDDDYYFIIRNPRDGVDFEIHGTGDCNEKKESWARYRVVDPDYGSSTEILSVQAAFRLSDGTEIVRGIRAAGYRFDGSNLEGKVSCVRVNRNGS